MATWTLDAVVEVDEHGNETEYPMAISEREEMKDAFEKRRHVPQRFVGRISTNPLDPGYQNWVNLYARGDPPFYIIEVRLDGVVQAGVNAADVEEGWVERLKCYQGNPVMVAGNFVLEKVKGEVEIIVIKESAS